MRSRILSSMILLLYRNNMRNTHEFENILLHFTIQSTQELLPPCSTEQLNTAAHPQARLLQSTRVSHYCHSQGRTDMSRRHSLPASPRCARVTRLVAGSAQFCPGHSARLDRPSAFPLFDTQESRHSGFRDQSGTGHLPQERGDCPHPIPESRKWIVPDSLT